MDVTLNRTDALQLHSPPVPSSLQPSIRALVQIRGDMETAEPHNSFPKPPYKGTERTAVLLWNLIQQKPHRKLLWVSVHLNMKLGKTLN
jgi:hypothetical protein